MLSPVVVARYPEGVKTSGWVASAVGAVVLVGGGIWAATTLPASDEATEPETAYTGSYEPVETETSEPSVEPTEAVETPDVEPVPEETVAPEYTELEQVFLDWARPIYEFNRSDAPRLPEMSDEDMLEALYKACEIDGDPNTGLSVIPGFATADDFNVDNAEDDANRLFIGAARLGTGDGRSYCD